MLQWFRTSLFFKLILLVLLIEMNPVYGNKLVPIDLFNIATINAQSTGIVSSSSTMTKKDKIMVLSLKNVLLSGQMDDIVSNTIKAKLGIKNFRLYQYTITPAELRVIYDYDLEIKTIIDDHGIHLSTPLREVEKPSQDVIVSQSNKSLSSAESHESSNITPSLGVKNHSIPSFWSFKEAYTKLAEADYLRDKGEKDQALTLYKDILNRNPDFFPVYYHMALLYAYENNSDAAWEMLQKTIDIYPDHTEALLRLGELYLRRNQLDEAKACMGKVLKMNPSHDGARLNLAIVQALKKGNHLDVKDFTDSLVNTTLIQDLAAYLTRDSRFSDAIILYKALSIIQPDNPDGYYGQAYAYQNSNDPEQAIHMYHKALELDPKYYNAYYNLGTIYLALHQEQLALQNFEQYAASHPQDINPVLDIIQRLKSGKQE